MVNNFNKRGFTLVELLVVISIIGILSTFAMVSLNIARVKSRDALRMADMGQLKTALILYFEENTRYPVCDEENFNIDWETDSDEVMGSSLVNGSDCYNIELADALETGERPIMSSIPKDPLNLINVTAANSGNDVYLYRYISYDNGSEYALIYFLEEEVNIPQVIRGW